MKKILCVLLALLMLAGTASVSAFAVEESAAEESVEAPSNEESEAPIVVESSEDVSESTPAESESEEVSVDTPSEDVSADTPSEDESEDASSEESAELETRVVNVNLRGEGMISIRYNGEMYSKIKAGKSAAIEVPLGEDAVFYILPSEEYIVSDIAVSTRDEFATDIAAGTFTISAVSIGASVEITLTEAEIVPVSVTVLNDEDGKPNGSYSGRANAAVGTMYNLELLPADGYGVKSVTVNGTALTSFPLASGTVSILIEGEDNEITVEYSPLFEITLICGSGGTATIGGVALESGDYVMAPSGRSITISVTPEDGNTVKTIKFRNKGNTVANRAEYSFTVEGNEAIEVSFGEEDATYTVRTYVVGETGGFIFPDKPQTVHEGNSIDISFVPDEGYVIDYVRVNGITWQVTGETVTITNIKEDKVVRVKFKAVDESSSEESEDEDPEVNTSTEDDPPENESKPDVSNKDYYDGDSIKNAVSENGAAKEILLKNVTVVNPSGLAYINELLTASDVCIGIKDEYFWVIPKGEKFAITGNIGIIFNGDYSVEAKEAFETQAEKAGFAHLSILHLQRRSLVQLPKGSYLKVNVVKLTEDDDTPLTVGKRVEWIGHDPSAKENKDKFSSLINDRLITVDGAGWVSAAMDVECALFLGYIDEYSAVKLVFDAKTVAFNSYGDKLSRDADGKDVVEFLQKSETEFVIKIRTKNGYCFNSISAPGYHNMKLFDKEGKELTGSLAGLKGEITVRIVGLSADGVVTVETVKEAAKDDEKDSGNGVDITIIVLIVVIAGVAIGGGVLFVIKWRQNEDDDDDYEDYDDDEED